MAIYTSPIHAGDCDRDLHASECPCQADLPAGTYTVTDWTLSRACDTDAHNACTGKLCLCGCHVLFGINDAL